MCVLIVTVLVAFCVIAEDEVDACLMFLPWCSYSGEAIVTNPSKCNVCVFSCKLLTMHMIAVDGFCSNTMDVVMLAGRDYLSIRVDLRLGCRV